LVHQLTLQANSYDSGITFSNDAHGIYYKRKHCEEDGNTYLCIRTFSVEM